MSMYAIKNYKTGKYLLKYMTQRSFWGDNLEYARLYHTKEGAAEIIENKEKMGFYCKWGNSLEDIGIAVIELVDKGEPYAW